jgi:NADH:ubiquinone oxidoreductase subunit 3 (subunit A)
MNAIDILISPPVGFLIFLFIGYLLYLLGGRMAPKLKKAGGKLATYACGEDLPGIKIQFGYRLFFFIALFFTMMHVAALVIATIPGGKIVFFGIIYLLMISLSIAALVARS